MSILAEALARSVWSRAICTTSKQTRSGLGVIEQRVLDRVVIQHCSYLLGSRSPVWALGRSLRDTRAFRSQSPARAAGKSLWVEEDDSPPSQSHGQVEEDTRKNVDGNGRSNGESDPQFAKFNGPSRDRQSNDWDTRDTYSAAERDFNKARRSQPRGYIDEWGGLPDRETASEATTRSSNVVSTSYGQDRGTISTGARRKRDQNEWDGEWGEYLDKVEKRTPRGGQDQRPVRESWVAEESERQQRVFADDQWGPSWEDADVDRRSAGSNRFERRQPGQRTSREQVRPGITKYDDKWKRSGQALSASSRGESGRDRGARSSGTYSSREGTPRWQATSGRPESTDQKFGNERSRGGMDNRRNRNREWEEDEEGPLVKGGIELSGEVLYGVAPVQAAIRAGRRELYTLYVQENLRLRKKGEKEAVERIKREAQVAGAVLQEASKHTLNLLADNRPHQGFVLDAAPLSFLELDELPSPPAEGGLSAAAPVWVALDEVVDPQNFGAVLRSAYFLGAAGVLTCARNSSPLTAVVSKASAGAVEAMDVYSCHNMPDTLGVAVQDGWRVLGASADPHAPLATELPKGVPTVIVLGNEGAGLRTNVRRACSGFVRIAGMGAACSTISEDEIREADGVTNDDVNDVEDGPEASERHSDVVVDSLNVSVAAGILLHELLAPRPIDHGQHGSASAPLTEAGTSDSLKKPDDSLSELLSRQSLRTGAV